MVGEEIPIHSVIVFSERCTLKKVTVNSPDIFVIKRDRIAAIVRKISNQKINKINSEKVKEALALYHTEHYSVQEILNKTGVSKATLYRRLSELEVKNADN